MWLGEELQLRWKCDFQSLCLVFARGLGTAACCVVFSSAGVKNWKDMQTQNDRVIAEILHAEDVFLIEVGRLTLLFSRIEDCLVNDARLLASLSEDEELKEEAEAPALLHLRVLEKRDFLYTPV
jgi:hypothetical protein